MVASYDDVAMRSDGLMLICILILYLMLLIIACYDDVAYIDYGCLVLAYVAYC